MQQPAAKAAAEAASLTAAAEAAEAAVAAAAATCLEGSSIPLLRAKVYMYCIEL